MGDAITIPKRVHQAVLKRLETEFYAEFGESKEVVSWSRAQFIEQYAKIVRFWEKATPKMRPDMSMDEIAAHAIATNSMKNITAKIRDYGVEDEVLACKSELSK